MRIQKILPVSSQETLAYKNYRITDTKPIPQDTVNFKGGISSSLMYIVIKEGYKGLKDNTAKAKFKNEIAQKMSAPDLSNDARQLVDVLFALAKTKGKDEPENILYGLNDKYDMSKTLRELRSDAIGKLFPLIPVKKNDSNHGNAAKTAMLGSLIDSGEYLECPYLLSAFKSLFNDSDKESLILKALRDKNVVREINETYVLPEAKSIAENSYQYPEDKSTSDSFFHFVKMIFYDLPRDMIKQNQYVRKETKNCIPEVQQKYNIKRAVINTALISTLDVRKHQDFFSSYRELIQSQSRIAFQSIANKLKENYEGKPEFNMLYKKYAEGLKDLSIPEEYLAINYLQDMYEHFRDNITGLKNEFNMGSPFCNDICKDYELLSKCPQTFDINSLKQLFRERINEKYASGNEYIQKSAGTLIYLSGRANELKSLLEAEKYDKAHNVLSTRMNNNNAMYGCKEPHIPTLEDLEKEREKSLEAFREANSSMSDDDVDLMEAHTRLMYL